MKVKTENLSIFILTDKEFIYFWQILERATFMLNFLLLLLLTKQNTSTASEAVPDIFEIKLDIIWKPTSQCSENDV